MAPLTNFAAHSLNGFLFSLFFGSKFEWLSTPHNYAKRFFWSFKSLVNPLQFPYKAWVD